MPSEHPIAVVLRAVRGRLTEGGAAEMWGQRVFHGVAPAGTARPFVVFTVQDAREVNAARVQDAVIALLVKVISSELEESLRGAQRLAALLNDAGDQDANGTGLAAAGGWRMTTVTQERLIQYAELVSGSSVFHAGGVFRFRLSSRS